MAITQHTETQHADALARYMPEGRIFEAKNIAGSVFRGWIDGSSKSYHLAESFLKLMYDEYSPLTTNALLDEWEQMLGLPDDCFPQSDDSDTRRLYICVKIMARGVQTVGDFQALADKLGIAATVIPGEDLPVTPGEEVAARYTIVVQYTSTATVVFPLTFPIPFEALAEDIMKCLFQKLKPANCRVIFEAV